MICSFVFIIQTSKYTTSINYILNHHFYFFYILFLFIFNNSFISLINFRLYLFMILSAGEIAAWLLRFYVKTNFWIKLA